MAVAKQMAMKLRSSPAGSRPYYVAALALALAAPLACGSGNPSVDRDDSPISEAGAGSDAGGSSAGTGAKSAGGGGGTGGLKIDLGDGGDDCADGSCDSPTEVVCGDGMLQPDGEECDDGNLTDGDGCNATCVLESGYVCPVPGAMCRAAACGDGILAGLELCDDGNTTAGDGCGATCSVEPNYACETAGEPCTPTNCGDGMVEGSEACDDGNHCLGDGCNIYCEREPTCVPPAPCTSACGDGIKLGAEACDDGNSRDGDGCSSTCQVEPGWTCAEEAGGDLEIPIVYRDFKAYEDGGHVAFQWTSKDPIDRSPKEDIWVRTTLGTAADTTPEGVSLLGRPVFKWYASCDANGCTDIVPGAGITQPTGTLAAATCNAKKGAATGPLYMTVDNRNVWFCGYGDRDFNSFSQWYLDVPDVNQTILSTLKLTKNAEGVYAYDNTSFFPLDGQGFGNYKNTNHNFHFTSEVRYWFEYHADKNATLTFNGDDDVWVFVNGKLTVDISGTHGRTLDSVTINALTADIEGNPLDLVEGSVYEIVVFQAERNTSASTYGLSLDDFELTKSTCQSHCGDGVVTIDEACDDGVNDGSYGTCNPDCSRAGFCGDGHKDKGESCDDGNSRNGDGCNSACRFEGIK